ncbi:Hypothetical protein SRAE_2000480700 [Strongyloides ratti]|uniref:Uncharacterized protein n=1 Tax=Strongyloides ratti TaxID=34506 RepID=A0A090LKE5_STRRB|nr:Hypothetical protein SRAE_2000480700 [Strongyloides ratti]CEF70173.1 Hypothetical protein SRAE_2000480700 [Strongyloides ratti]
MFSKNGDLELSDDNESLEDEVIDKNANETCQIWILRYLKMFLNDVEEEYLIDFIQHNDISPMKNFIFNFLPMSVIFIKIRRPKKIDKIQKVPEIVSQQSETLLKNLDEKKKKRVYSMKINKKKKRKKSKKKEQNKKGEKIVEDISILKEDVEPAEIILEWSLDKLIPNDEFIFITVQNLAKTTETELDEENEESFDNNFFVGYVENTSRLNNLFDIGRILFGDDFNFNSKMELLIRFISINSTCSFSEYQRWDCNIDQFMDFIYDCIVKSFTRTLSIEILSDFIMVESIEELLKPRIDNFVKHCLLEKRNQILMELSLFELKYIPTNPSLVCTVNDINRILKTLLVLYKLFTDDQSNEWYRKIFFRLVEISCGLYGDFLKAKCKWLLIDIEEIRPKRINVKEIIFESVKNIIELTIQYAVKEVEQNVWMEKIKSCLKIMIVLEEELDELLEIADFISDEKWDTLIDRSVINECIQKFKDIWKIIEYSCIETAFESGNNEALKELCFSMMKEAESVKKIIKIGFMNGKFK